MSAEALAPRAPREPREPPRAIALLDPVGDSGIGGYTHELAQGLVAAGARVHVYTTRTAFATRLRRDYVLVPAFDPALLAWPDGACRVAALPPGPPLDAPAAPAARAVGRDCALDPYFDVLAAGERRRHAAAAAAASAPVARAAAVGGTGRGPARPRTARDARTRTRAARLAARLALRIANDGCDTVWTQWPTLAPASDWLREHVVAAELRLVHTVHNVLPHEAGARDRAVHERLYARAGRLVVHSQAAADALTRAFPATRGRVVTSRHGTYTIYPRAPEARAPVRARLGVGARDVVVLFFGGVRPYKNVDALLAALPACGRDVTLVVAGWEWGYPDAVPGDRLGRTRALAASLGVAARVRLLPGPFGVRQTSELFEACDVVALPYVESSGSGVLCMGLTFGRHVLCTEVGGMGEYLGGYAAATCLGAPTPEAIAEGVRAAADAVRAARQATAACGAAPGPTPGAELAWPTIAARLLGALAGE